MQRNIGRLDQYVRLVSGLLLVYSSQQLRARSFAQVTIASLGAMKIAEGITGWCPLLYAMRIRTTEQRNRPADTIIHAPNKAHTNDAQNETKKVHESSLAKENHTTMDKQDKIENSSENRAVVEAYQ